MHVPDGFRFTSTTSTEPLWSTTYASMGPLFWVSQKKCKPTRVCTRKNSSLSLVMHYAKVGTQDNRCKKCSDGAGEGTYWVKIEMVDATRKLSTRDVCTLGPFLPSVRTTMPTAVFTDIRTNLPRKRKSASYDCTNQITSLNAQKIPAWYNKCTCKQRRECVDRKRRQFRRTPFWHSCRRGYDQHVFKSCCSCQTRAHMDKINKCAMIYSAAHILTRNRLRSCMKGTKLESVTWVERIEANIPRILQKQRASHKLGKIRSMKKVQHWSMASEEKRHTF